MERSGMHTDMRDRWTGFVPPFRHAHSPNHPMLAQGPSTHRSPLPQGRPRVGRVGPRVIPPCSVRPHTRHKHSIQDGKRGQGKRGALRRQRHQTLARRARVPSAGHPARVERSTSKVQSAESTSRPFLSSGSNKLCVITQSCFCVITQKVCFGGVNRLKN